MTAQDIAEEASILLRRTIETIIDHPRDLNIDYRLLHGRVDFIVLPNINDQGKVVGKMGAHIKALKLLMSLLGERQGVQFVLRLEEDTEGTRLPDPVRKPAQPTYSCSAHKQLLSDILKAILDEAPSVTVERDLTGGSVLYVFRIEAQRVQDYERLVVPGEDQDGQTVISALGTLFRAAGLRDGVGFKLEIPSR